MIVLVPYIGTLEHEATLVLLVFMSVGQFLVLNGGDPKYPPYVGNFALPPDT